MKNISNNKRPFGFDPKYWSELISVKPTLVNNSVNIPDWNDPELFFFEDGNIPVAFYRPSSTLFRVFSGEILIPLSFKTMFSYVYDSNDFISKEEALRLADLITEEEIIKVQEKDTGV